MKNIDVVQSILKSIQSLGVEDIVLCAGARNAPLAAGPTVFVQLLRDWREKGDFAGLERDGQHARGQQEATA